MGDILVLGRNKRYEVLDYDSIKLSNAINIKERVPTLGSIDFNDPDYWYSFLEYIKSGNELDPCSLEQFGTSHELNIKGTAHESNISLFERFMHESHNYMNKWCSDYILVQDLSFNRGNIWRDSVFSGRTQLFNQKS